MTSQTFINELKRLVLSQPKIPVHMDYCENCTGDYIFNSKNLYNCFDCPNCTDSSYLFDSFMCATNMDCDYAVESELCYESVDIYKCFNSNYLENCARVRDSVYSYACRDSNNIFGCVNLRNKSFCIFNRQLTEDEYKIQVEKYRKLSPEQVLQYVENLKKQYPWSETNEGYNENAGYGNFIYYNKNCYLCFDAAHNENCGYLYDSFENQMVYDSTQASRNQLTYEVVDSVNLFNCNFAVYSARCNDSSYLFNCEDIKNSFGCVGLKHKEYIFLNRQLTKEQYEQMVLPLIEEFKTKSPGWSDLVF